MIIDAENTGLKKDKEKTGTEYCTCLEVMHKLLLKFVHTLLANALSLEVKEIFIITA